MTTSLTKIKRLSVEKLLADLKSESTGVSSEAGAKLCAQARDYGLQLRDYLKLAVDVRASENPDQYSDGKGLLSGYEASLSYLGLPVRNSFEDGVTLDLASDTFQTYSGTRALFPEVVDDMLRWQYRQDQLENVAALVGSSRTTNGVEVLSTVVPDKEADYQGFRPIAELAKLPINTIQATQNSVKFWKYGGGYRTSYEFARRARLDMLTPYAARLGREVERSKVGVATAMLINGDTVQGAAPVVAQSTFNAKTGQTAVNGKINYLNLLAWLVARASTGVPVDTVVGNWDAYLQWLMMFAVPQSNTGHAQAQDLAAAGFKIGGVPLINGVVNFALSSTAPANQLIGFSKVDTLEEMVENGSLIQESERAITNQSITYTKTENTGYRLPFGDTRSIYNFGA